MSRRNLLSASAACLPSLAGRRRRFRRLSPRQRHACSHRQDRLRQVGIQSRRHCAEQQPFPNECRWHARESTDADNARDRATASANLVAGWGKIAYDPVRPGRQQIPTSVSWTAKAGHNRQHHVRYPGLLHAGLGTRRHDRLRLRARRLAAASAPFAPMAVTRSRSCSVRARRGQPGNRRVYNLMWSADGNDLFVDAGYPGELDEAWFRWSYKVDVRTGVAMELFSQATSTFAPTAFVTDGSNALYAGGFHAPTKTTRGSPG